MSAGRSWSVRRYLRRACAGMGPDGGSDAVWAAAVLRRVPQAGRPLRSLGGGLSVDADEPERACQTRYSGHPAAGTALRGDAVNAALLGMRRVMSEDSVRRALAKIDEAAGVDWLQRHLDYTFRPLLGEPWILDVDTTVKPLYGRQEGAVIGYNPHKPGRPSHTYHTYAIAELRLMLEVEVQVGNQHASKHSAPGLWALLARIGRAGWPRLLRGDCDWGTEANMSRAEREGLPYLFKLRLTRNAQRLIERAMMEPGWVAAGHGWQGKQSSLRLVGWSRHRRVILLRRRSNGR